MLKEFYILEHPNGASLSGRSSRVEDPPLYLIASRIPPGLGSEALRLGLEAPGLKARGCRVVLQEGDDVLEESEGDEGDEGARPGELPGGGAHSLPAQDLHLYLSSASCIFLKLFDFRCAPKLAPLLGDVDIDPSASKLQVSCNEAASVAAGELHFLLFLEFLIDYCRLLHASCKFLHFLVFSCFSLRFLYFLYFLKLLDFRCAPKLVPLLGGKSTSTPLQVSCR